MLPYMDTDGEDHVRGLTSARCTFTAHLRRAEITGVKLPWQQACIIVTSPSVSPLAPQTNDCSERHAPADVTGIHGNRSSAVTLQRRGSDRRGEEEKTGEREIQRESVMLL